MYISFSGIDSSGKSTQILLLEQYLLENKVKYKKIWGKIRGTPGILFFKKVIRKDKGLDDVQKQEYRAKIFQKNSKKSLLLNLSIIDFIIYYSIFYRFLNCKYKIIIFDRYIWDSFIEVTNEFGINDLERKGLWKILVKVVPKPLISFVFTISPELSLQRDISKNDPTIEPIEIKKEKINLYNRLITNNRWTHVINGENDKIAIHKNVVNIVVNNFNKKHARKKLPLC